MHHDSAAFFPIFLCVMFGLSLLYSYNNQFYNYVIGLHSKNGSFVSCQSLLSWVYYSKLHFHFVDKQEKCDIFEGQWVRVHNKSSLSSHQYTNSSCATLPDKKNCFKHGRMDREFLEWRWQPDRCDLPTFDAALFREIMRGKTLGFVGDSVGRNQMDSLLCLLSPMEAPAEIYKDGKDRNIIYHFSAFNFTLRAIWTKYLASAEERANGAVDVRLERMDDNWAKELPNLNYLIISTGQWFFRPMYIHEESNKVACVYCNDSTVALKGVQFALQMTFRAALRHINECANCGKLVAIVRTLSPSHFENGGWNTGGKCDRVAPLGVNDIDLKGLDWETRNKEVDEVKRARKESKWGVQFDVMDITKAMMMRPDGHPGAFWRDKKKGSNDCVHWCLPGPVDLWNDFLLALLTKYN